MAYRTFGELKTQVEKELDLELEDFVQETEMWGYFNSAVTIVESEIIKLGLREQYLKQEDFISIVSGTADYNLPTGCVATKIRKMIYRNGTTIYKLRPFTDEDSYEVEDVANQASVGSEYYRYSIYKDGEDYKFRFTPEPQTSVSNAVRVIFWKSLNRYTDDDDNCDVPDICVEYILSHVRYKCMKKEVHVNKADEVGELAALKQLMVETLQNQIADPDADEIEQDLSHYEEMT